MKEPVLVIMAAGLGSRFGGLKQITPIVDNDIIMHINSVFFILQQLGIGPEEGYCITDEYNTWSEFVYDAGKVEIIKSYIYLKVKLLFDPPASGSVIESINRQIAEFEWRLSIAPTNNE